MAVFDKILLRVFDFFIAALIYVSREVCLEGVCAIDMMVCNKTDSTYVIEANGNGSLNGIEKITGENVAGAIIEYAEKIGR